MRNLLSGFMMTGALIVTMISVAPVVYAAGPGLAVVMQPEAKKHFDAGVKAIQTNQLEKARAELLLAWQTEKHYRIAANLGRVEIELRQYRNAAEHLDYCLRNEAGMSAEHKVAVQALLDEARAQVGTLDVRAAELEATILVDGQVVGHTPLTAVFVDPGQRTITARMDGKTFQEKRIDITAGQTADVDIIELPPPPPKLDEVLLPKPKSTEQTSNWKYVAVPIGVGVSVAGLAVGIGYTVAWNQVVDDNRAQIQVGQVGNDSQVRNENAIGAGIGYAVSGTALLATLIMAAWPTEKQQSARLFVSPIVGGGQNGVVVGGSF